MNIKIAVDFDGTLCKHRYPEIGEPLTEGIEFIKSLRKLGVKIYLDTMRSGKELEEAVEWCKERGLEFDGVGIGYKKVMSNYKLVTYFFISSNNIGTPLLIDEEVPYINWDKMMKLFYDRLALMSSTK